MLGASKNDSPEVSAQVTQPGTDPGHPRTCVCQAGPYLAHSTLSPWGADHRKPVPHTQRLRGALPLHFPTTSPALAVIPGTRAERKPLPSAHPADGVGA